MDGRINVTRNYLVTGVRGMLGSAVLARLNSLGERAGGTDLPGTDLTVEAEVEDLIGRVQPTHVIHCAAYTDVNGAESHEEICRTVNVTATGYLARACAKNHARLLYISTDYVFDGTARRPYREDDVPNPLGVYARSKLDGERVVAGALGDYQIVRTAWLYGEGKGGFVAAILKGLRMPERPLQVVEDETGNPTYAPDLAAGLVDISQLPETGIFHLVNEGQCTRFEQARKIAELSGNDSERILPIRREDWPSPVERPAWSVLDCSRARSLGVRPLRHWAKALEDYINRVLDKNETEPRETHRLIHQQFVEPQK
jgi:dTDP-4-dehydrorhamnose reductase